MAITRIAPKLRTVNLKVVRMWREDIDDMVGFIKDATVQSEQLTIVVNGEDLLDDVNDLSAYRADRIRSITVSTASGTVRLHLGPYPCKLTVQAPDPRLDSMINGITGVAKRCGRLRLLHNTLTNTWKAAVACSLYLALIVYLGINTASSEGNPSFVDFALVPAAALGVAAVAYLLLRPLSSVLHTRTRREAPPFWKRKRDDVLINLASLIAGGFIGYWINVITK